MSDKKIVTKEKKEEIKKAVKEVYAKTERQRLMKELKERYYFHLNEIRGIPEYCLNGEEGVFNITNYKPIDDYSVNSILNRLDAETDIRRLSSEFIGSVLRSDFVKMYHPVKAYFKSFEQYDNFNAEISTNAIQELANTVKVENPEVFFLTLKNWLVSSVAQVFEGFNTGCKNSTAIVLCSDIHGIGKTTFIAGLCPPCLRLHYYFQGKVKDLDSSEMPVLLAEKFIINIDDQFHNLIKRDNETMKTYISHGKITIRRPYDKYVSELARLGNFIGSINNNNFMDDGENRRYFPFEVTDIDKAAFNLIDIDYVWFEAYRLYLAYKKAEKLNDENDILKYKYWWDSQEIIEQFGSMDKFKATTQEYELFLQYFQPCKSDSDYGTFKTNTEILTYIKTRSGLSTLTDKKLGSALKRLKCFVASKRIDGLPRLAYKVRERLTGEHESSMNEVIPEPIKEYKQSNIF